jgi:hypothetical protein
MMDRMPLVTFTSSGTVLSVPLHFSWRRQPCFCRQVNPFTRTIGTA